MQLQPNRIRNHLFVALDHTSVITEPAVYYVLMPVKYVLMTLVFLVPVFMRGPYFRNMYQATFC